MKQKFLVEVEWNDEKPVSTDWFEKIIHDGMSDNGIMEYDGWFEDEENEEGLRVWDWGYKLLSVEKLVDYKNIAFDIKVNKTKYEEIEGIDPLWDILFPIAEYKGGSLHCDEWIAEHEGKEYRLLECGSGMNPIRSIEVKVV